MSVIRQEKLAAGIHAVIINRPGKRNACDIPTWEALTKAFEDAALDPDIRVLVFAGAGGHFCAGDDIASTSQIASDPVMMQRRINGIASTFKALRSLPIPVIAAIDGACIGIGCAMASYCDFRVASQTARIGITAINHAIGYPTAHVQALVNLMGLQATRKWLYGAELHDAASAAEDGFVDFVAADARQEALRLATPLLGKPRASLAIARAQLDAAASGELLERVASIELLMQAARTSDDRKEAIRAFIEKRKPRFTSL